MVGEWREERHPAVAGRLEVGPAAEVRRFIRRARPQRFRRASRPRRTRPRRRPLASPLLHRAGAAAPPEEPEAIPEDYGTVSTEPLDPWRDPVEEVAPGLLRVAYGFQTRWSPPDRWALAVAPQFPACCFVLGWVEPNMDLAGSLVTGRGATRRYQLGARRKERVYEKHQRGGRRGCGGARSRRRRYDLFADWDADAEVSDLLIARWESTVLRRLQ